MEKRGKKRGSIIKDENGSVLAIVLMLMVIFTLIGISAVNTTMTEARIVRNETQYKTCSYKAEAAAMEAVQMLENTDLNSTAPSFLLDTDAITENTEVPSDWTNKQQATSIDPAHSEYLAVSRGISGGSSLGLGSARVHTFIVYGKNEDDTCSGRTIIAMGYRKPF